MVEKIITHVPPRHLDDFVALCILYSALRTDLKLEFIHPQKVTDQMRLSRGIILVDVGMCYDPKLNNFDHHQDINLPCSAILVLNHFFPDLKINKFLYTVDIMDRFGFRKCVELKLCNPNPITDKKRKIILNFPPQKAYKYVLDILKEEIDYDTAIDLLYQRLYASFKEDITKIEKSLEKEEEEFKSKLKNVQFFVVGDLKIGISLESFAPDYFKVFDTLDLDVLIEKNKFDEKHTSIVVNTASDKVELAHAFADALMKNFETIFVHSTKFIRVVNTNVKYLLENFIRLF